MLIIIWDVEIEALYVIFPLLKILEFHELHGLQKGTRHRTQIEAQTDQIFIGYIQVLS